MEIAPSTLWDPGTGILRTRISGRVTLPEAAAWKRRLHTVSWEIPRGSRFRFLVDLRGYVVADVDPEVHKVQREVVPVFLAMHHFRTAFLDFFGVEGDIAPEKRDAYCEAVAHVHHDCPKMDLYHQSLAKAGEDFFCVLDRAEKWLSDPSRSRPAG